MNEVLGPVPGAPATPAASGLGSLSVGVGLVAMATLLFEVTLTRVFAIMMWHHFAYMIVSLALLGFGASGSLLTVLRVGEWRGAIAGRVASFATASGIAIFVCRPASRRGSKTRPKKWLGALCSGRIGGMSSRVRWLLLVAIVGLIVADHFVFGWVIAHAMKRVWGSG